MVGAFPPALNGYFRAIYTLFSPARNNAICKAIMHKFFLFIVALLFWSYALSAQTKAENTIRAILQRQQDDWNAGRIDAFMTGYWDSERLMFIGSKGLTYGWRSTLENYRLRYPDRATMGTLTFTLLSVEQLSKKSAFVVGKWQLARSVGDVGGHFTLLWKKIKGKWVIVADHTG
jgi:Domain of unknown function (DUF4440)